MLLTLLCSFCFIFNGVMPRALVNLTSLFSFQYFVLTSKGELKSEDNCLDYNGYDLYLRECDGLMQNQKWEYKV